MEIGFCRHYGTFAFIIKELIGVPNLDTLQINKLLGHDECLPGRLWQVLKNVEIADLWHFMPLKPKSGNSANSLF